MKCRDLRYFHSSGWYLFWCVLWLVFFTEGVGNVAWVYIYIYFFRLFDVFDTGMADIEIKLIKRREFTV